MAGHRRKEMLSPGAKAPAAALRSLDGQKHSLAEMFSTGPALLAFFKISCPVCQFTIPYLDRIRDNGKIRIIPVSQDDAEATQEFLQAFRVATPPLLDEEEQGYPASNGFAISQVPSLFQIESDGTISHAWMGWSKSDMQALGERAGLPVLRPGEQVPALRPG